MSRVHLMFVLSGLCQWCQPLRAVMQASCHHRTALFIFLDVYLLFWCKLFTKLSKISRSFCFVSLSRSHSLFLLFAIRMLNLLSLSLLFCCCCCCCCSIPPLFSSLSA
uniref:(northern house mosquito) hypothetical protein n=1 Tax=Culex pipiens TaxID=7175 RepID=A0A8D8BUT3_CULPI